MQISFQLWKAYNLMNLHQKRMTNLLINHIRYQKCQIVWAIDLNGEEPLVHKHNADIISEPIAPGSVQVPINGQPIILLNDRQTIGGYTKIATVSFIGREKLSQLKANDSITFKWISFEEATVEYQTYIKQLEQDIDDIKLKNIKDLSNIRPKSKK